MVKLELRSMSLSLPETNREERKLNSNLHDAPVTVSRPLSVSNRPPPKPFRAMQDEFISLDLDDNKNVKVDQAENENYPIKRKFSFSKVFEQNISVDDKENVRVFDKSYKNTTTMKSPEKLPTVQPHFSPPAILSCIDDGQTMYELENKRYSIDSLEGKVDPSMSPPFLAGMF